MWKGKQTSRVSTANHFHLTCSRTPSSSHINKRASGLGCSFIIIQILQVLWSNSNSFFQLFHTAKYEGVQLATKNSKCIFDPLGSLTG